MERAAVHSRRAARAGGPTLVFLVRKTCGVSRRMESLVAWVRVTQKKQLRVVTVDADRDPDLVEQLGVSTIPALVLIDAGQVVGMLEGRTTGLAIDELIRSHVGER